ncbi:ribosome hibernation-promoting factor, HPF/YfiA family [Trueperella pecoris]|uniref:ribosome hibernation-promoting factor, HPF/YfiA family n=1 Tax=Trueperella pecoris TaxID=2733571 RepID=UPI00186B9D8F|nr:ribosome-associated translation inhibitor RaiA [Trueperella pecoris]QOQ38340.1 ribosome-associated translation inhibitor RaiA [Trueperella pecoris]QTG75079.1 ribosome-associated translation inhibitor RaiA [Trueperella pecoris]
MEIVVTGRNTEVQGRFRAHAEEKLAKIEQYTPYAQRVEVEVTHETNPSQVETSERIEITVRDKGPVVRAEASASDRFGALDLASQKLFERLRRRHEKKKNRRKGERRDEVPQDLPIDELLAKHKDVEEVEEPTRPSAVGEAVETQLGDSPAIVRQKLYEAKPMSVEQAIDEMELVGHPFYLFIDEETKQPCAAYRRRGWTYGVIRLDATTGAYGPGTPA